MTIVFIGLGLIGGSFAIDLRALPDAGTFLGVDTDPTHAKRARELGLVDEIVGLDEAMERADTVILAIPVDAIANLLPQLLDRVRPDQTVIDLGSTKRAVAEAAAGHPHRDRYVAAHPMAGTENCGPDAALPGLFKGKVVLLCDLDQSAPDACRKALEIFHAVGLKFEFMTPEQHDRHAADRGHRGRHHVQTGRRGVRLRVHVRVEQGAGG